MLELVDKTDLKSVSHYRLCGFESHWGYMSPVRGAQQLSANGQNNFAAEDYLSNLGIAPTGRNYFRVLYSKNDSIV